MPIIRLYYPDGRSERIPIGYKGDACDKATAPYEAYDVAQSVEKTDTSERYERPVQRQSFVQTEEERTREKR